MVHITWKLMKIIYGATYGAIYGAISYGAISYRAYIIWKLMISYESYDMDDIIWSI